MMKITWYGHSCFRLECRGYSVVIDPYTGVPGYSPLHLKADQALKSQDHADHSFLEAVELTGPKEENPFRIETIPCWHDDQQGALRGSNVITVFEADGVRAAHFGDIGQELDAETLEQLKGLDAALIPTGGFYTIDGRQAAALVEQINPGVVIPMHYRWGNHGYQEISELDVFTEAVKGRPVIVSEDSTVEIGKESGNERIVILRCEGTEV